MKKLTRARTTFTTVVAGAAVLTMFGTGTAVAGGLITSAKIKNNTIKSIDVKNDSLQGIDVRDGSLTGADIQDYSLSHQDIGVLFATVNTNGSLANSSGGVASYEIGPGRYEVDFGRDITNCAFVATIANPGDGVPADGAIATADRDGKPTAAYVRTWDDTNTLAERSFHLVVVC